MIRGALSRREFVGALSAMAALPPWRAGRLDRIGIQLFTLRRELAQDVEGTLAKVAAIGFAEVEFTGYPAGSAASLRKLLDRHRLAVPSAHVPPHALRLDWGRALDAAATLGQRYVVVAWIPPEERRTLDDWKRWAAAFNLAGESARRAGMQFAYHNHDFEFVPQGGTVPFDLLLQETDPALVQVELDLYWCTRGGRDPLALFARWPGRFPLIHVKDMDRTPRRFFTELGRGSIDFKRIFARARQAGIRHCYYEQDATPGPAINSARISYHYLRQLEF